MRVAVLLALVVALASTPAFAGPPTDRLREFFTAVDAVLADPATVSEPLEKVARVKRLVADIADVRGAAAGALGSEWQARTPTEREQFTELFADLLERGYVARLAGLVSSKGSIAMAYGSETQAGDEATVQTTVRSRDGREVMVEYRMTERRGRWLVRDVTVDGLSTVGNYRAQFKRLLRDGSYADLIQHLRAKLGEETLMFAQAEPRTARVTAPKTEETVAAPAPARAPVAERAPAVPPATPRVVRALPHTIVAAPSKPVAPSPPVAAARVSPPAPAAAERVAMVTTPQREVAVTAAAALPSPTSFVTPAAVMTSTLLLGLVTALGVAYRRRRWLPGASVLRVARSRKARSASLVR